MATCNGYGYETDGNQLFLRVFMNFEILRHQLDSTIICDGGVQIETDVMVMVMNLAPIES